MKKLMARLLKIRQRFLYTPREVAGQLAAQNQAMAIQRQALRDSINALAQARIKRTGKVYEIKLTINAAALETCLGEAGVVEIAAHVARKIIERHRAAKKPKPSK